MHQLILTDTVELVGRDIFGRYTRVVISPNHAKTGWVWNLEGQDIPITPDIMENRHKRVALVYKHHEFHEFEHLGILRLAGLEHVRIWSARNIAYLPFCGGSRDVWKMVMPHTRKEGVLEPFSPTTETEGVHHIFSLDRYSRRKTIFLARSSAEMSKKLHAYAHVDFPSLGVSGNATFETGDPLLPLVSSRTLGWPSYLRIPALLVHWISKILKPFGWSWPHYNSILWASSASKEKVLDEVLRHRLLDMLAIINFLAPPGHYLIGNFHSILGGHRSDIKMVKALFRPTVVRLKKRVVA